MPDIAQLAYGEENGIHSLIRESFDTYISQYYSSEGINEFYRITTPEAIRERLNSGHIIYYSSTGGKPAGIIEVRNNNHIVLLFVSNEAKGTGVGKSLLNYVTDKLAKEGVQQLTVNSSPNSVGFCKSRGK
ncbi:GNAT family N-acetyltransferase [Paenibacillus camerounensis]|uniref:GNAT family N-acetyltransferase n=1 Tax=Paenibacillus camerounensis TaxID=1243663 RepID=UPI0005A64ED5|nr:GNAT family N-acetyltransferase [Paenibacillus camerounensis]